MQTEAIIKRNNQIYENYREGKTRSELAKEHNLSRERIRQICNRLKMQREKTTGSVADQAKSFPFPGSRHTKQFSRCFEFKKGTPTRAKVELAPSDG
jgi:hypothetical protein